MAERQSKFLLKRSNVAGKAPSSGQLLSGELALNTADAILYTSGSTANSILPIGWDRIHRTGDTMTGPLQITTSTGTTRHLTINAPTTSYLGFSVSGTVRSTIGSDATGDFIIYDDQSSTYRVVVDFSGNVGIGTNIPTSKLEVKGITKVTSLGTDEAELIIGTSLDDVDASLILAESGVTRWKFRNQGDSGDRLRIGSSTNNNVFTILQDGSVGINNINPSRTLDVSGATIVGGGVSSAALTISTSIGNYTWTDYTLATPSSFLTTIGASGYYEVSNSTGNIKLDSSGNVGVGIVTPTYKLDVSGTSRITSSLLIGTAGSSVRKLSIDNANGAVAAHLSFNDPSGTARFISGINGITDDTLFAGQQSLRFYAGTTIGSIATMPTNERFVIHANGGIGIGLVSGGTPSAVAILELSSTTKGFLPTRMTTAQRNAITPLEEALTVYDLTTHSYWFYNGTIWVEL